MLILNEVIRDGRVLRCAKTVASEYDLTVLGVDRRNFEFDPDQQRQQHDLNLEWVKLKWTGKWPRNVIGYAARYSEAICRMVSRGIKLKPDVIHAHEAATLPIARMIRRFTGAKIIYDAHELYREMTGASEMLWKRIAAKKETWDMRRCDAIIACNSQRAEIMHAEYGAPFLPAVIRNMPPFREYTKCEKLRNYVRDRNTGINHICLHQGGIQPGRGMEIIVSSLKHLSDDTAVVLVGGGGQAYIDSLLAKASEDGVSDRFFVHGPVNHSELFEMTCSADVGIVIYQPVSRNNYLCAPNKLYEYAQAGLPMVGADLPPIREFLEITNAGLIFDTEDPQSLANSINQLISDSSAYEEYKTSCLAAAKDYCWDNEAKVLLDIYHDVLTA